MAKFQFGSHSSKNSSSSTPNPGFSYKLMVRLCGLGAIGFLFLPVFSGVNILEFFTGMADAYSMGGFEQVFSEISSGHNGGPALVTGLFLMLAYILIPLMGLYMLVSGRYAGGPLTFVLLFNIAGWLIVHFWGAEIGIESSFFGIAGIGYYGAMGSLFLPFIGMFFLDKSI